MTSNQAVKNLQEEMTSNEVENCPVCYSGLTLKNMVNLRCSHQLCKDCFYNWVDETGKNTCPCCRDEIMKSENFMREEKLRAEVAIERMEFAADVWKEKRDMRRNEYKLSLRELAETNVELNHQLKKLNGTVQETARLLCLQNKYKNKIRELRARVTVSMSPYECRAYYQWKLDKSLNRTEKKARNVFKGVLSEMKEVFNVYLDGKGRSSFCEDILMLIDGLKFSKELEKESNQQAEWNISDMFDAEVGQMSEEDEKLEKEYNEKNRLFKESLREMRECVGMMNEDPKTDEGYKVLRAFGVRRQWIGDEYDYSSNDNNNYKSRPIIYKYNKRVGEWIWIHDEREEAERYEAYDWARERDSIDEETEKIMQSRCYRFFPIEEEEDMNLSDMFNELEEGELEDYDDRYEEGTYDENSDTDTDSSMPELEDIDHIEPARHMNIDLYHYMISNIRARV